MGLSSLTDSLNTNASCRYHPGIHEDIARSTLLYADNNRSAKTCGFIGRYNFGNQIGLPR